MLVNDIDTDDTEKDATYRRKSISFMKRENIFGAIPGTISASV